MKYLLKIAFSQSKYIFLIILTVIAMGAFTFASYLELVAVGVITEKGASAFELFGRLKHGELREVTHLKRDEVIERFDMMDKNHDGVVTPEDAREYLSQVRRHGFVPKMISYVDSYFPISGNITNLAIMVIVVGILKAVALFWHRLSVQLVAIKISQDLRQSFFEHLQTLSMSFYQKHNIGSLSSRVVTDAITIAEGINSALINYFQTPFTVIATLSMCFLTSWKLSLVIFFGIPTLIFPIMALARKVKKIAKQIQTNQERFTTVLIDYLSGIQTVKAFSMEDFSLKKYRHENDKMAHLQKRSARYAVSSRPIVHSLGMFFLATALIYGLYVLKMHVSEVLVYCGFLLFLYEPIKKFAEENASIQRAAAAADRMQEVMSIHSQVEDAPDAQKLAHFENEIAFDDVWFQYEQEWVLRGLSFKVKKGETVAIVGPTGAGKSTIAQLLPRLYDIQKGSISIDGIPIQQYTQRSLRDSIAFVPQKPFLFLDTVAANIAYGRPYNEEQIRAAALQAHADEFIQKLPNKYHTEIAETGKNLSGGQQQRLAIARALVKQAPILIMDEATSSLDNISEQYIKSAIRQLHGKVTQIIIAHRLTTIEDADRIIYLHDGEKIAEGTIPELLETCLPFRALWEAREHKSKSVLDYAIPSSAFKEAGLPT